MPGPVCAQSGAADLNTASPSPDDPPRSYAASTDVRLELKDLPRAFLRDQKTIWLRPFRLRPQEIGWTSALLGTTAVLILTDADTGRALTGSPPGAPNRFGRRLDTYAGGIADYSVAGAFYLAGRWGNNAKAQNTGVLALRAVTDSLVVTGVLKGITQRPRPSRDFVTPNHNSDGAFFTGGTSFPSGHSSQAWALAAVVAYRYEEHRWVPPAAYGLAGMVGVSRVLARKHFPSDVLVGSVIGFLIGRHVALDHRSRSAQNRAWRVEPFVPQGGGTALRWNWSF